VSVGLTSAEQSHSSLSSSPSTSIEDELVLPKVRPMDAVLPHVMQSATFSTCRLGAAGRGSEDHGGAISSSDGKKNKAEAGWGKTKTSSQESDPRIGCRLMSEFLAAGRKGEDPVNNNREEELYTIKLQSIEKSLDCCHGADPIKPYRGVLQKVRQVLRNVVKVRERKKVVGSRVEQSSTHQDEAGGSGWIPAAAGGSSTGTSDSASSHSTTSPAPRSSISFAHLKPAL
ncbi:unnamed protein product, partial [Amoebophrya sp. A120]